MFASLYCPIYFILSAGRCRSRGSAEWICYLCLYAVFLFLVDQLVYSVDVCNKTCFDNVCTESAALCDNRLAVSFSALFAERYSSVAERILALSDRLQLVVLQMEPSSYDALDSVECCIDRTVALSDLLYP